MKKTTLTLSLAFLFLSAFAQDGTKSTTHETGASHFSIGLEAGLPVGTYGKAYTFIIGGTAQYEYMPASDLGITVSAGYLNYSIKKAYNGGSIGFIPLMAGLKYYFDPGTVFLHGQLGAAIGTKTGQNTSFAYAPGIGVTIAPGLDAEVKYMGISNPGGTIGNIGLRIGYNF